MLIAYDLDDTLFDTTSQIFKYFNTKYEKDHTIDSVVGMQEAGQYDVNKNILTQLYGPSTKELDVIFFNESMDMFPYLEVINAGRIHLLDNHSQGLSIVYITARNKKYEEITRKNLLDAELPDGTIYFTQEKGKLAKELGVIRFYEDSLSNIRDISSYGIQCTLIDTLGSYKNDLHGTDRLYWNDKIIAAREAKSR
jgi:uncharacterized HAD superfamily protein